MNYYNEWDKGAAAWLRELIKQGHIPFGVVDERSITEVKPEDLDGFTQCHFFAGIGGWPLALRLAGVPEDAYVYFVHSYYLKAQDEKIVTATTEYGTHIHASVESGNLFACQFHPEKSSHVGLQILKNFAKLEGKGGR